MKTIELENIGFKRSIDLMKYLLKNRLLGWPFHYFFEPQLIIRTNNTTKIISVLKKLDLKYKIYKYPYPKKGFGEDKKYKSYQTGLIELYGIYSLLTLVAKKREKPFIFNRINHTFLNMNGFEFYDEAKYYISQANGYMKHQYREDGRLTTLLAQKLIGIINKIL